MLRRKSSLSGGNKKDEAKQKGAHDQGGIPSVPESQDSKGAASEGACGRSPLTSEDKVQTEQSQYTDGCEEPDGSASSRITGGLHTLNKKERKERIERKEAKKREKDKQVREKKEAERQEKERNEREKQKEKERKKMEKQKTRNASQSKQRNSSSQDVQPPVSPNESHLPQEHRNPSEGSQGSQAFTGIEDATLEEGTKQTSSEAQEAMSKKIPPSSKNKKGEPLQMGAHDQGGIPQSPGGTGAASEGACGQSSTTPEDRRHSKQSQHSDGRGEVDDGVSDSSQTSGGRSKSSKRSKKKKKEKEGEQNDGEVEGVAEGQQRTRSTSVFKRFKKTSQGSQPPLSPNENQMPQRRHTHSEGSEGSEIPAIPKKTGFQRNEINVDSLTADLQLEVDLLRLENAVLKQEKCKEITTLKCEKEQEVAKLKEESEKCVAEIREALDQQRQEVERVQAQKQKLENELKTHQDEETARDQKNLAEVKNELEMLQRKFESKQTELGNLNGESESATNKHTNEMEVLKAKHARVLTDLQREKEQTIHEKEGEIELWQRRSKEVEEENAKLHKKLEEKNKVLEGDKDTCTCLLPTELIQQKMKKLTGELEEAQLELSESRKKLAEKAEEVNRLIHELEDAKVKHAEELQTELTRKHAEHTEEIDHLKADFEKKRKHDGQYIEQQMEKKLDQREKASRERRLELKNENEGLKKQLKQKEDELKACITSMKGVKEQQLQKKIDEIKSLNEQLNKAKSQQHKVDNELKKLRQELQERDSELSRIISEKEAAQKAYDKLVSNHKQLQSDYEQLEVMVKLRKHEEASAAAATTGWIHSSDDGMESETAHVLISDQLQHTGDSCSEEKDFHSNKSDHQDNLTDIEKADLRRQVHETQGELLKRDQRIKELDQRVRDLEQQLTKHEDISEVAGDPVEGASDKKGKTVSYSVFDKMRQSYTETMEKLVKLQEKHERVKNELMEKLEERQKQLEGERQMPRTHQSFSSEDHEAVEDMDHETAVQEIGRLRVVLDEKERQVLSLETQVQSFSRTAAEKQELEKHTKEQSRTVLDWRKKFDALEAEYERLKESNDVLVKKINEFEEHEVSQKEFDAANQNVKREQDRVHELEGTVTQLQHEIQHLQEMKHWKEYASSMLKRFKTLLGKSEAECSTSSDKELTKKLDELMSELEAQKLQAQYYKEDFEAERKAREEAAGRKEEEIAEMQALYSKTLEKHDDMQRQLTKALGDLDSAQKESEDVKKVLQDAIDNAAKNLQEREEAHEKAMKTCLEDAGRIVAHNQQEMQTELAKLNQHITNLEEDRAKVSRERDQLSENRDEVKRERDEVKREYDDLKKQIQELCDQNEELEDQRKAKEKEAELNAAERNELENEVRKLRSVMSSLQTEVAEVKQQLTIALADKETLSDESLAKTQQVKQYKKQVDNFRIQLAESNAKLEQYQVRLHRSESDLAYCQKDLQSREEDGESKVAIVIAQHESEMSAMNSELGRLRREKADVEQQLRQLQKGVIPPETADLVDSLEKEKTEWKHKYTHLRDSYDGIFRHNDQLAAALEKHNIPVPVLQKPGAGVSHSPHTPHVARQNLMGQEGRLQSLPMADEYGVSRDGGPDKSITSPAAIGQQVNQPFDFNQQQQQQQLVIPGSSSMPHQRMIHKQQPYQHGYAGQGAMVVAPGQQNQGQGGHQAWQRGHQGGGGATPGYHQGQQGMHGHQGVPRNQQIPQHGMGPTNGAGIGMEPQQLAIATEESGRQRMPSGPQENALIQGINTEIHDVAAGVGRKVDSNSVLESLSPQAPYDPNLICPMCRRQFRIGEIQKYRQHVKLCHGT